MILQIIMQPMEKEKKGVLRENRENLLRALAPGANVHIDA